MGALSPLVSHDQAAETEVAEDAVFRCPALAVILTEGPREP